MSREIAKNREGFDKECEGLRIPLLVLTDEEAAMDVTPKRISQEYHYLIGEDFLDCNEVIANCDVFAGYLLALFPEKAKDIIKCINHNHTSLGDFRDLFEFDEEIDNDGIYIHFCNFVNLTEKTKRRVNEQLLSVKYYYEE